MRLIGTEERNLVSGRQLSEVWEITAEEWRGRQVGSREQGVGIGSSIRLAGVLNWRTPRRHRGGVQVFRM